MQKWSNLGAPSQKIAFLLFDRFSNLCLANAVEPLRAANNVARRQLYDWRFVTLGGTPIESSSGIPVTPNAAFGTEGAGDLLFVLAWSLEVNALIEDIVREAIENAIKEDKIT